MLAQTEPIPLRSIADANKLAEENIGLAADFANMNKHRWKDRDELKSLCFMGLVKASREYDESRGASFKTYAFLKMREAVFHHIAFTTRAKRGGSVRRTGEDDEGKTEQFADPRSVADPHLDARDSIEKVMQGLKPRDRDILVQRIGNDMTLQEVGDSIGLTRERVRQIEAAALLKCRKAITSD